MQNNVLLTTIMPIALGIIMLGLGLSLTLEDFKRVIVFPGNGSDAKVIPLTNNNTTLTEAIAMAGGITDRGRANHIKVMRRVGSERKVYKIDLSFQNIVDEKPCEEFFGHNHKDQNIFLQYQNDI